LTVSSRELSTRYNKRIDSNVEICNEVTEIDSLGYREKDFFDAARKYIIDGLSVRASGFRSLNGTGVLRDHGSCNQNRRDHLSGLNDETFLAREATGMILLSQQRIGK